MSNYICPVCKSLLESSVVDRQGTSVLIDFECPKGCFLEPIMKILPEIILEVDSENLSFYISKHFNSDLLLEAFNTYETDFVEEDYGEDEQNRETYFDIYEAHEILRTGGEIKNEVNYENLGSLIDIIEYYIRVRREDLEGSADDDRVEKTLVDLPKLYEMKKNLSKIIGVVCE